MKTTITVKPGLEEGTIEFDFSISMPFVGTAIESAFLKAWPQGKLPGIKPVVMSPLTISLSSPTEKAEEALQKIKDVLQEDHLTSELSITVRR